MSEIEAGSHGRRTSGRASVDRPLLRIAALLCIGSLIGASEIVPPTASRPALLVALGALTAAAILRRPPARSERCAVLLQVRSDGIARCALHALIVLAAAQRAQGPESNASAAHATAWLDARGRPGTTLGIWHAERELGDRTLGRIGDDPQARLVPAGICANGDLVALLAGAEPRSWPRGPEPGPRSFVAPGAGVHPEEGDAADAEIEGPLERPNALLDAGDRPAMATSPDALVRLAPARPDLLARAVAPLLALRVHLLARVSRSEATLARGLVRALLFGDLSELREGLGDLFVRTGTFHVLAVSGMQVGLVALWVVWPLGSALTAIVRLVSARRLQVPVQVFRGALLFLFVPLAGAEPPVLRAAVAYGIGSLAALVPFERAVATHAGVAMRARRRIDTLSLWSLALALECLVHPRAPLSLSVTLSYAATLGLIVATGPVRDLLRALLPGRGRVATVGATGRPRARGLVVPAQRLADAAFSALAASIAAVLATLPCVWSRFGEWSPVGLAATPLLLVPVATLLGLGLASIALPRGVLDPLLDVAARATVGLLELCDRVPASPAVLPPRPALLVAGAVIVTIGAVIALRRGPHGFARAATRLAALAWAALLFPWQPAARAVELWALDVGNGTAFVLRAPGLGTWLFDAGSRDRPDVARQAVAPLLRRLDVGSLGIVLSHEDRDHDGALPWLCDRFPPRVWAGASPERCLERIPHGTLRLDLATGALALPSLEGPCSGGSLALVRGSSVEGNEGSRSLAIRWLGERILLCGDAEEAGLGAWLRSEGPSGPLRLLTMPHHGSDTELLGLLLARTRPEEIWISSSTPPAVARELDRRELSWRWTARDGPLHLELPRRGPREPDTEVVEVARPR